MCGSVCHMHHSACMVVIRPWRLLCLDTGSSAGPCACVARIAVLQATGVFPPLPSTLTQKHHTQSYTSPGPHTHPSNALHTELSSQPKLKVLTIPNLSLRIIHICALFRKHQSVPPIYALGSLSFSHQGL